MKTYKVIFHIDEMDKWKLVLTNTQNLIDALSDSFLEIEILANSMAVKYFVLANQDDDSIKILSELSKKVHFCACNNSLRMLEIDPKTLFDFVTVVPSGVAELTIKQDEGFAYIKP